MAGPDTPAGGDARLQVTTPGEREVALTRRFAATRHAVFECWTTPELLRRWLTGPPGVRLESCELALRPGGAYRVAWRSDAQDELVMTGTWQQIDAPARLAGTQRFEPDWTGGETLVTLELTEQDDQTLAVLHIRYASRAARDGALASGMTEGVAASYDRLDAVLASLAAGAA